MPDEQKQLVQQVLLQQIEVLFEAEDSSGLKGLLNKQRSSDVAEVVELLNDEQRCTSSMC